MRGLGVLLLVAAALKLYGLAVGPVGAAGIFSEPWMQMLIVEWEVGLGAWLLWGANPLLAWLAATVTFVVFGRVSWWQGWVGQTSCGCFGAFRVNPWIAFTIDVVVLIALASVARRALASERPPSLSLRLRPVVVGVCGVLAIFAIVAAIGAFVFGSLAAALAHLRGDRLSVEPRLVDVGQGFMNERKVAMLRLRNWTGAAIRVIGGTSDCSCIATDDLPLSVPADGERAVTVRLLLKGPPGQFTRTVVLFTDDERFRRIAFRLTGRIQAQPDESVSPGE